jgi:site-specific DNA recombinase
VAMESRPITGPPPPLRAVLYSRVSTDDQAKHGTGLDLQLDHGRQVIERNGWTTVGEYTDDGISGTVLHRPALDRLLAACRAGEVDVMVVYDWTRLGRKDSVSATIREELEESGVRLCVNGQVYDSTDEAMFMGTVFGGAGTLDKRKAVRRMTEGLHQRAKQGAYTGGMTPYGVTLRYPEQVGAGPKPKAEFVIDEAEANCIRAAWKMVVVEHKTAWQSAVELNALGHRPRQSERWTPRNLRRVLMSPSLKGEVIYAKTGPKDRPHWHQGTGRYGEAVPMTVPAVLSGEEWQALQSALARSSTRTPTVSKAYLLSGRNNARLLTPCQGHMFGRFRNDRQLRQYVCGNSQVLDPADRCSCPTVNADRMEFLVRNTLIALLTDPDQLREAVHRWMEPQPAIPSADTPEDLDAPYCHAGTEEDEPGVGCG